jgi:hypothetical protein
VLQAAQAPNNLLNAEVVASTQARGEGIDTRHLAPAQPCPFSPRALTEGTIERSVRRTGAVELEEVCDVEEGPPLVAKYEGLLVAV